MINIKTHPILILDKLKEKYGLNNTNTSLIFCIYDDITLERRYVSENFDNVTEDYVNNLISNLKPNEEFGLYSKITFGSTFYCIPFIDFKTKNVEDVNHVLESFEEEMLVFHSGNSYHAYSTTLLSEFDFTTFIGRLLLIYECEDVGKIIDVRWIGHTIVNRFPTMRWSCTNKIKYPELINL